MKAIKFRIICWVLSVVFSIISFRIKKVFPRGKFLYEPSWNLRVSMKRKIGNKSRGHKLIYIAMNCFYITFYMWQIIMAQKKENIIGNAAHMNMKRFSIFSNSNKSEHHHLFGFGSCLWTNCEETQT